MNFKLFGNVIQTDLERYKLTVRDMLRAAAPEVESEMAAAYRRIVLANFGESGIDRPAPWPMLSQAYAKKVGRSYATLYVSGALESSIKQEGNTVSVSDEDVPYATAHQYGLGRMPARPYFPMNADGTPTNYTRMYMNEVARRELRKQLAGGILAPA